MVDIKSVLCPVDFSDASPYVLQHAAAIAQWYDARIVALYVMHPLLLPEPSVLFATPPVEATMDLEARIERQLYELLAPAKSAGLSVEARIVEGVPTTKILESAGAVAADVIVMGTHGRSGFDRLVLGSVAEKVLRKAGCPVLTVPPSSHAVATFPYKRLLCPVDFSTSSLTALEQAFALAKESDAHVTIFHALDWPSEDELVAGELDRPELRRVLEARARARLDALVTDEVRTWCEPETRLCYGKPSRLIVEIAEHDRADLIVMGVRGRSAVDLSMFGSTTHHIVRNAGCPVLTWKH